MELTGAAGRVLHASRLYRAGKVKRILVSAGNIPWLAAVKPEAELIKELPVEWGVPGAHMPRAMAVFRRAGLPVIASTADVLMVADDEILIDPLQWLPSASALSKASRAAGAELQRLRVSRAEPLPLMRRTNWLPPLTITWIVPETLNCSLKKDPV